MLFRDKNGGLQIDSACDASLWGLFAFGMYDAKDPRIEATMKTLRSTLWLPTDVGGMARYEGDSYYREDDRLAGNPWFICTMWLADYMTQKAETEKDLQESIAILEWAADHALPSGVLAEQVHPMTGQPLSVSPLTWSHATFVNTGQKIIRKLAAMKKCAACGHSLLDRPAGQEDWLNRLYGEACDVIHGICKV
jgi:GH15 family glucan-1,4-alpha-glucosidase